MLLLSICDQGKTLFSKCTSSRRTCLFIIMFFTLSFYFVHVHSLFQMNVGCLIIELLGRTIKCHFYRFGAIQVLHTSGVGYERLPCIKYVFYFLMLTCYHLISLLPDTACLLQKSK